MSRDSQDRWDAGERDYKSTRDQGGAVTANTDGVARELAAALATLPKLQGKNRAVLESAVEKLARALAKQSISPTLKPR